MKQKNSFIRFFEVFKYVPIEHMRTISVSILFSLLGIVNIEIFGLIIKAIQQKEQALLMMYVYVFFGISIFLYIIKISPINTKRVRGRMVFKAYPLILNDYITKYSIGDNTYIEKLGTGKLQSILERGISAWLETIHNFNIQGLGSIIFIIYFQYKIFSFSILGGIASSIVVVVMMYIFIGTNSKMKPLRKMRIMEQENANKHIWTLLSSKHEILQYNFIEKFFIKIKNHYNWCDYYQIKVNFWANLSETVPQVTSLIIKIGLLLYFIKASQNQNIDYGEFIIMIPIITIFENTLQRLSDLVRESLKEISKIERLWETFDNLPSIQGYDTGSIFKGKEEDIKIKNIFYGYGEKLVFKDFSLEIKKGKKTALVGLSGGGKTTLIKLIAGYVHPEKGSIHIMGNNLSKTSLKTYYPHIGYLTQEPGVFDASIRDNLLASATKEVTESDLQNALKNAKCDFIESFKDGLDTEIGERGIRLSGGQKQRLAIAKIFLKNPEIILLDEPTSALDSFSEEIVTEGLDRLFEGRTVIIVAHRLQTVKKADDIIVIENGEIIERGKHSELVKMKGTYHRMLELQSGF